MAMRPTAVMTLEKDLNVFLSGLDRADELEQKASRGTFLIRLAASFGISPPLSRYKGVPLEGDRQMLLGGYCSPGP